MVLLFHEPGWPLFVQSISRRWFTVILYVLVGCFDLPPLWILLRRHAHLSCIMEVPSLDTWVTCIPDILSSAVCLANYSLVVTFYKYLSYKTILPTSMNFWKNTPWTSCEISVPSSQSSNVNPLPRYRNATNIKSSKGDNYFPFLPVPIHLGNQLPSFASSANYIYDSYGKRNRWRHLFIKKMSPDWGHKM